MQKLRDAVPRLALGHSLSHVRATTLSGAFRVHPTRANSNFLERNVQSVYSIRSFASNNMGAPEWPAAKVRQTFLDFFKNYKNYEHEIGKSMLSMRTEHQMVMSVGRL